MVLLCIVCGEKNEVSADGKNKFGNKRPIIGNAIRVLMKETDVVIAHQRLGHAGGINMCDTIRKNVYFRVVHKRHEEFQKEYLSGRCPFTEFEGLVSLDGVNAGHVGIHG